jgi:transposase-like protein
MSENKGHTNADYLAVYERLGSMKAVAREMGVNESTVRRSLNRLKKRDPAMQGAMDAVGTGLVPSMAWIKTKATADTPGYSVMLRPAEEAPEETAERIKDALVNLDAIDPVAAPIYTDADLCTLYPISDVHVGMRAWAKEVGEAYDTDKATERLVSWIGQCVAASPAAHTAIVLDVGDLTHADSNENQTPRSKHQLDVDSRHFRTLDATIQALAVCTELALAKHQRVIVRILPGNHNINSYMAVMFALAERFRDNDRVSVQKVPGEFFVYEFGKVLLAAHHGDKAKADRMVHFLADQYAEMWGRTKHRFLFTGHLHHHKSQDIGGVQWEQLRAVTPRDAYAVSNSYIARAQLQAITFDRNRGEISRVKVNA